MRTFFAAVLQAQLAMSMVKSFLHQHLDLDLSNDQLMDAMENYAQLAHHQHESMIEEMTAPKPNTWQRFWSFVIR